jgi:transposase-like protein
MLDHKGREICNTWLAKHGHKTSDGASSEYSSWISMRARCLNESSDSYQHYGGRGIKIKAEWIDSFSAFLNDMGPKPGKGYTIDRIDVNGDYVPENCRWASSSEQSKNKRNNVFTVIDGEKLTLSDVSRKYGVPRTTIHRRFKQGYRGGDLVSKESKNKGKVMSSRCHNLKVNLEMVKAMRLMRLEGSTYKVIAEKFNVSYHTAYKWVNHNLHYEAQ